jgi:hypothetical protein
LRLGSNDWREDYQANEVARFHRETIFVSCVSTNELTATFAFGGGMNSMRNDSKHRAEVGAEDISNCARSNHWSRTDRMPRKGGAFRLREAGDVASFGLGLVRSSASLLSGGNLRYGEIAVEPTDLRYR